VHEDTARFLSQPVEAQPGSPLRVAVYSRIAEAIRNNLLQPGSMLPTETVAKCLIADRAGHLSVLQSLQS
jgi:DNA-binding GntR family transcriptional regulator